MSQVPELAEIGIKPVEQPEEEEAKKEEEPLPPEPGEGEVPPVDDLNPEDAKYLCQALIDQDMTPKEISEGIEGRVSMRTIYRWSKGESVPQNMTNLQALIELALSRGITL